MIQIRTFRNSDPPMIAAIWNECFTGRGSYPLLAVMPLERCIFSKSYFDANGFIVAIDGEQAVGFAHAGFGTNADQDRLDQSTGVVCAAAVRPAHQRRGIGGKLLARAESYLRERGSEVIQAGACRPNNPFYLGLYGGGDSPGVLASDPFAESFFRKYGYETLCKRDVFQRQLDQPMSLPDFRIMQHRKRYDIVAQPTSGLSNWWQENVVGLIEPVEFRLEDRLGGGPVGRAVIWELEGFSARWNAPSVGIYELIIRADRRGIGLGKFFMVNLMRYVQEQYFGICECHVDVGSPAAGFLTSLGFSKVDEGTAFVKRVQTVQD